MTDREIQLLEAELKPEKTLMNPFPGLRPFGIEESHLFFGREGQSDEVLARLGKNRFVSVMGASGSGKSSLMYCGLISTLYGGFMTNSGSKWKVIVSRPGNSPIENLAESLLLNSEEFESVDEDTQFITRNITTSILRSSSLGLMDALKFNFKNYDGNIFILIDQFEEISRYKKSEKKNSPYNDSFAFVNLLISAVQQSELPIYVAITLRSDFLGECAQYPGLTKLINASQYLVPQMTRDQKRLAIEGPIAVGGGKITPQLVQQLLNDVGDNPDQLPVLQHALMRTWDTWVIKKGLKEPLDIPHYDFIGRIAEALSKHANEAYEELSSKEKDICVILFKALTEKRNENYGIRRPCRLDLIAAIAGVSEEDVQKVIEKFRQPGRSFLIPGAGIALDSQSIIEVSHESLMRIWTRLKIWVDEEFEAAQMYLRLSEAAAKNQIGKAGLWRPPDLQLALNWKQKYNPTLDWAQRYDLTFERTIVFLESSNKAFQTESRHKEKLQKRTLKRARVVALVLGLATVVSLLFFVWGQDQKLQAEKNNENTEKQKIAAEKNALEANRNRIKAEKSQLEADERRLEAEMAKVLANSSAEEAIKQQQIALYNQQVAEQQTTVAEKARKEAVKQSYIAKYQSDLAKQQENIAVQKTMEAYNLLLLSVAQSMAVKSTQISENELKALLAKQAYLFYKQNKGNMNDHYIYDGLYYALKQFEGEGFNLLPGHTNNVRALVNIPGSNIVFSSGSDGKTFKWDLEKEKADQKLINQSSQIIRAIAISPDNKFLAVGGEKSIIELFDLSTEEMNSQKIKNNFGAIYDLAFSKEGLFSLSSDRAIHFYDFNKNKIIYKSEVVMRSFSYDSHSNVLGVGNDNGEIILLDSQAAAQPKILFKDSKVRFHSIAFSNDGKYIAAGDEDGVLRIWDITNRKLQISLNGHNSIIRKIKFSSDDKMIASSGFDGKVILWFMDHLNDPPNIFNDHNEFVWSLSFTGDNKYLIAGCGNGKLKLWPTSSELLADKICDKISRNLTTKEWERYIGHDIPYQSTCSTLAAGKYE
ncbi:hypothetical protein BH23BAC1_BH23BAC1_11790 [soil metagenome]